jgi:hypothetical protein
MKTSNDGGVRWLAWLRGRQATTAPHRIVRPVSPPVAWPHGVGVDLETIAAAVWCPPSVIFGYLDDGGNS